MNRIHLCAIILGATFLYCGIGMAAEEGSPAPDSKQVMEPVRALMMRLLGDRAEEFFTESIEPENGRDTYEVKAEGGKVTLRGSSIIAITRALYDYLRNATNSQVTWSGVHLNLPRPLPDFPDKRITTPYKFRLYYNVCAFGYTTAFWDWERWERELDWMALHGINMPLAMVGEEAIWQKVWNSYGLTNDELKQYFSGPAFLPWHRMGNLNKHDGPLPQGWIEENKELQKKILNRMRQLGMTPVVPAFSGFVPPTLGKHHPLAVVQKMAPWAGFSDSFQTYMLSPKSSLFVEIGKKFIEEYRREYGECHYYLSDSFNEMEVPVTKEGRYGELAEFGEAVYRSIVAGDPTGTWIMQGWLFYNSSQFWDTLSARALLSRIPDDRMIIIDLANEFWHGWKEQKGFYGKQWIYSVIHNFGGNNPLNGALKLFAEDPAKALQDPERGNLVGFGISPEGIENNEVIYELLTDVAWSGKTLHLDEWLGQYSTSRYGSYPVEMARCWQLLLQSTYDKPQNNVRYGFQQRPGPRLRSEVGSGRLLEAAVKLFLSCHGSLEASQLYRNDLVELAAQAAGSAADRYLTYAGNLQLRGDHENRDRVLGCAIALMRQMDKLLSGRPDMRLERWITYARRWGRTEEEKDYYERDARRQVTVWGGPYLSEYAAKVWSGLIRDYYARRWELYYEHIGDSLPFDIGRWEENWITTPDNLTPEEKFDNPLMGANEVLTLIDSMDSLYSYPVSSRQEFDSTRSMLKISFYSEKDDLEIRYAQEAIGVWEPYSKPLEARGSMAVRARAYRNGFPFGKESQVSVSTHKAFGKTVRLRYPYSAKYNGGGRFALTDCLSGSSDFRDGRWQGFQGDDLEAVIDMGEEVTVKNIGLQCLQSSASWIFLPATVEFSLSQNGTEFTPAAKLDNDVPADREGAFIKKFSAALGSHIRARYIKVLAKNLMKCPPWHPGAGGKAWLFADEISVE